MPIIIICLSLYWSKEASPIVRYNDWPCLSHTPYQSFHVIWATSGYLVSSYLHSGYATTPYYRKSVPQQNIIT